MTATTDIHPIGGPSHWKGSELKDRTDWIVPLDAAQQQEVRDALAKVEAKGFDFLQITRQTFELPTVAPVLRELLVPLLEGRGFVLLRGLDLEGLTERQIEMMYWGLGLHMGISLPQGAAGTDLFAHVRNEGVDRNANYGGGLLNKHAGALPFHTDSSDIVGLLCIHPAMSGGMSTLVSAAGVHDEALRRRPDLVEVMYRQWWFDRKRGDGPDSFAQCPIFGVNKVGKLFTFYGPDLYRTAQRAAHVPQLTEAHHEALALLNEIAYSEEFRLDMWLQRGDIQFANNYAVMHSRTEYEDFPDPALKRDLIRLWLTVESDLGLPESFAERGLTARSWAFTK